MLVIFLFVSSIKFIIFIRLKGSYIVTYLILFVSIVHFINCERAVIIFFSEIKNLFITIAKLIGYFIEFDLLIYEK